MEFKLPPIDVPSDDPFRFDGLGRKESVEALTNLVAALKGPFTVAVDSPWGTGKTTFIRMWKAFLESQGFYCLYFDAWSTDFSSDPLVAFLGELDALLTKTEGKAFEKNLRRAKKLATILAKRILPTAGKIATAGLVDLDDFTEKALAELSAETIKDAVDAYTAEKVLIAQFRDSLSNVITGFRGAGKKDQLVVFVDEIDRCRPTFAVELLERIKHLFSVESAIFVLALDKTQLAVSLKAIYGNGLNVEEYLRRFVELEYLLPQADPESSFRNLYSRFGFDEFFKARTHPELRYEGKNLADTVIALSRLFHLSLRAQEQCLTRIRVAMMTTPTNEYFYPFLLAPLVLLKAGAPSIYRKYTMEGGTGREVLQHLRSLPGGTEFLDSHNGVVVEAYLVAASTPLRGKQSPEFQEYLARAQDPNATEKEKKRTDSLIKIIQDISMRDSPTLSHVVSKIELAAQFKR